MCGSAWAFAGIHVRNTLLGPENRLAIEEDLLKHQRDPAVDAPFVPGFEELRRNVYGPDWQERRYPDLKGLAREDQRRILYDKMVCDAMIGVQIGLLWAIPLYLIVLSLVPAVEALAAGSLWRRYRRPWPVTLAYVERVIPLALTLIFGGVTVISVFVFRTLVADGSLGMYQRAYWPMEAGLTVLVIAQIATWRGWSRSLRLFLHAAGIGLVIWARSRIP
jgi:hypothetical protein